PDHRLNGTAHMLGKGSLEHPLHRRFLLLAGEQQVAACDEGFGRVQSNFAGDALEILHLELASADVHRAQERDIGRHAASSRREAWARASSVIEAPDSIRAISSRRSSSESLRTVVRVPSAPWLF